MKPKFGIVGCGNISRFHFNAMRKAGVDIVHIADLNEKAAEKYVNEFGSKFSMDFNELIDDPEVTVVSILTDKLHKEIALKALESGKDVICEKTMANNPDDAEAMVRAVKASGRLFFSAYMKRFFPAVIKAMELIPSLGRLFSAQVRSYQNWGNFYEIQEGFNYGSILGKYGGAVVKCAGSHMLDMMLYLLGRPQSTYADIDFVPGTDFDRKATSLFEYPEGMVVSFEAATHSLKKIGYERNSWDEFIEITGVGGRLKIFTVQWEHQENNAALLVHYDDKTEVSTEYRFDASNPFDVEIATFSRCLEERRQISPDVTDGFNVDVLIQSMFESARKKSQLKIDWRGL